MSYMRRITVMLAGLAAAALAFCQAVPAGASPAAVPAVSGTEHFQSINASATASTRPVIAFGVFTAPAVDHIGNGTDRLVFPAGTVKVEHSMGTGPVTVNPKTCLFTANQQGTVKILGGTGKYAGIRGGGTFRSSVLAILARSGGKCSMTKPPAAFQHIIQVSLHVTL